MAATLRPSLLTFINETTRALSSPPLAIKKSSPANIQEIAVNGLIIHASCTYLVRRRILARVKLNILLKNIVQIYNSNEKFFLVILTMQAIMISDKGVKPLLI